MAAADQTNRRLPAGIAIGLTTAAVLTIALSVIGAMIVAAVTSDDDAPPAAAADTGEAAAQPDATAQPVSQGSAVTDSVTPELTPVAELETAPADEVHVSYAPAVPPPVERDDQRIVEVHLEVVENVCPLDPANDVTTLKWGFRVDGDEDVTCGTPGPVLRARVGDVARVTLTNPASSQMAHNIDFHAVTGQGGGAAGLTVAPGETGTIEARLLYPGAFMYHCAFGDVPEHIARGMYGMFIVDPEEPLPAVEHEWAVMQSEWYVGEAGDDGQAPFDRDALFDEEPRYVTFNGRTDALSSDNALTMQVGERARIYMVNEGLNLDSNWHPIGSHWDVVYPEAATHPANDVIRGSQSTLVVAGGGTVTELIGQVPSTIILVDHALVRTFYKGAIGQIVIDGSEDPEVFAAGGAATDAEADATDDGADGSTDEPAPDDGDAVTAAGDAAVTIPEGAFQPDNADTAYQPLELQVAPGTTVTWTNEDSIPHTVTSGESDGRVGEADGRFDSGNIAPGETWSYTFEEPGTYDYFCTPHPWMRGTVVIAG